MMTFNGTVVFTTDSEECINQYVASFSKSLDEIVGRVRYALKSGDICAFLAPNIMVRPDVANIKLVRMDGKVNCLVYTLIPTRGSVTSVRGPHAMESAGVPAFKFTVSLGLCPQLGSGTESLVRDQGAKPR